MDRIPGVHEIEQMIKETEGLRQVAEDLGKPLRQTLAAIIQRGQDLANEQATPQDAQTQDAASEYQNLISSFKQLSNAAMPLSQEILLLEQVRANYIEWRRSIWREYTDMLRSLLIRVVGIAL